MQTFALIIGALAGLRIGVALVVGANPYLLRKLTEERPEKITDLTPRGVKSTYTPGKHGKTGHLTIFKRHVSQ